MKKLTLFTRKNRNGPHGAASRSQALLEFALALPILLMLIFGIIDLAALFQAWLTVENIARQTVRYAVTGQYDLAFCVDLDSSGEACDSEEEQDIARLESIKDYADRQTIALFYTPGAQQPEIGYLNVTICSSRDADPKDDIPDFTFYESSSANYSDCQKNGASTSDAGAPGDRVIIAVDFNHPYITPIFNQVWPMTHLFSHREGIVEMFRVPRLIALPFNLPTSTLSGNEPATATLRPTEIPTNTPLPIQIEITSPAQSGLVVTNVSQTNFEAVAWNPPFGSSNGDGISEIAFWFTGPATIPGRSDPSARFCAFGAPGNSPCRTMDEVVSFTSLANGTYTIYARARGIDGRYSEIVSKTFILQFPATATPTITRTPTSTPLPSCNDVFITDTLVRNRTDTSQFRVTVRNNNQAAGSLTGSTITWSSLQSPPLYFDFFWFLNTDRANRYYDPSSTTMFDSSNPTISWSDPAGAHAPLAGEAKTIWGATFQLSGQPFLSGNFNVSLTFFFPDLGECVVSTTLVQPTPSPTPIPPTKPPTPTPICQITGAVTTTDFNGDPQNVNGYDCAFGCIRSPYLKSNQLPPGNYFWTLSTVGNNSTIVNNGTFTLNPGQQAGPPSGVVVPLGRNMYNVPPGYFPGEFKVSVYQSADPGCNAKTDNLKIQAQAPTPAPTKIPTTPPPTSTKKPTSTPAPTNTPTPTPTRTPGGFDN
jgi:hypothetical protein